jgi:hypothetical protein
MSDPLQIENQTCEVELGDYVIEHGLIQYSFHFGC